MSMGIKVGEFNTLSDGKGITCIRFFNEMENTKFVFSISLKNRMHVIPFPSFNESTNLRKLADVWM